jgi:hypothetical protein
MKQQHLINQVIDRIIAVVLLVINFNTFVGGIFVFIGSLIFLLFAKQVGLFLPLLFFVGSLVILILSGKHSYLGGLSLYTGYVSQYQIMITALLIMLVIMNSTTFIASGTTQRFEDNVKDPRIDNFAVLSVQNAISYGRSLFQ